MIPYFSREDVGLILYYLGKIIKGMGIMMLIPFFVGVINKEWAPSVDFLFVSLLSLSIGSIPLIIFQEDRDLNWRQGMSIVAICWIVAMFLGAIPLYLSGHYLSFLDASFEAMSAFATTGLVLVNDLDHMAYAYNFWRHFMCFIGGQGIILVAITLFVRGGSVFKVYVGEAREEKIMPNVIQTARFIWLVSLTYLVIFTVILTGINLWRNISPGRALFHSVCLFMAGWDTAGFAVQSQNVLYYHSPIIELVTAMFCLLGAVNFGVHYAVWTGKPRELLRNYELKLYVASILATFFIVCTGLVVHFQFPNFISFFREGFYQLVSSHTGVGYSNISVQNFSYWSPLAILGLIIAMGLGGSSTSTAGGIKILRIGIILKGIKKELKILTSPESTIVVEKFHHIRDMTIEDNHVKMSAIITILYITLYLVGGLIGVFYGYQFLPSLFESVSASANVGLSMGITSPFMPAGLKITYIIQMWLGRLEFISAFVLIRFLLSLRSSE
ncbi:MAG: TrkH family potassium uptake protein [Candidatus Ratteibacteria bacterium]|nr:TrkH family potassium uptake protein [Candidatus Ratteibacteria bacterium]